jgi:putative transport protein
LSETNFLPIALGIVLGVLLGSLEIPVGSFKFALGSTGGVLAAGLILSRLGKTGPVLWSMSGFSNQFMRELGLLFFLAAVGTEAGGHLVKVVTEGGWNLIVASLLIAVMPMVVATIIGHFFLRMNFLSLLGVIAGGMTSTPGLAAVDPMSDSDAPALAYATVYPFALVGMVVACQIVARL